MKRPGPPCTVCAHPKRSEIDASNGTAKRVGAKFGVSASTLQRHRSKCLVEAKASKRPSLPPPPTTERDALLAAAAKVKASIDKAETEDLPRLLTSLNAISKRLGQLDEGRDVTEAEVLKSAAFQRLTTRALAALKPYPDAARALMQALEGA